MHKPENDKASLQTERERIEGLYTAHRIFELQLYPVQGNFDIAHLKEINRRIFQDLPGVGFDDVTPGQFRPPVSAGQDWIKNRQLSTVEGVFYVAYSPMDEAAQARLAHVLQSAVPKQLRELKTAGFTAEIGKLYAELDYLHPFRDGNSRTLRTFTQQLANESGYELAWDRFNNSQTSRDVLYIARDLSVNTLAKPYLQNDGTLRKIVHSMDCLADNRDLSNLLHDAIRPSRAIAFEQFLESDALLKYPELRSAYQTLHAASSYFQTKMPDKPEAQQQALKGVLNRIQDCLNKGETHNFSSHQKVEKNACQLTSWEQSIPGPEHER